MKYVLALLIGVCCTTLAFSQEKTITFTDDSTLDVTYFQKSEDVSPSKISIGKKYLTADFKSVGKAVSPLKEKALKKLTRVNKPLAAQVKKIDTAYLMGQADSQFYLATFDSVNYENFRACNTAAPCKIKCETIIITLDNDGKKENILIVKSIRKVK